MTAANVALIPSDELCELVRGELRPMSPVCQPQGRLAWRIGLAISHYFEERNLGGEGFVAEQGFFLTHDPDTIRCLDFAYLMEPRATAARGQTGFIEGAPDIAVEVVSESDSDSEVEEKIGEYLSAGAKMVMVVNPRKRQVTVHFSARDARSYSAVDTVDGGEVMPGFELPLSNLFN